jgi:hypothetical protein
MIMGFHLILYLLGCGIEIYMSINFFSICMELPRSMNWHGIDLYEIKG